MPRAQLIPGLRGWKGGMHFLLRDEFITALVAGSVNGTLAEPGPGTRIVADSAGNKLSIASGAATWAGVTASNDPNIGYGTYVRELGRMLFLFYPLTVSTRISGGFHPSLTPGSGNAFEAGFGDLAGNPGIFVNLMSQITVLNTVTRDTYFCIILRAAGAYLFHKIPSLNTAWFLDWFSNDGASANLYALATPRVAAHGALSYIRIPTTKWIPTPLAYDTFTRADGAIGNSEAGGPDGVSAVSLPWTNQQGTVAISGGKAIATALAGGRAICTLPIGVAHSWVEAALIKGTTGAGVVFRYQDVDNYVYAYHDGVQGHLISRAGGVETSLVAAATSAYAAGKIIGGLVYETSGCVHYGQMLVGTQQAVPNSTYEPVGMIFLDTDSTLDNFTVFARGLSGQYSALNLWSA